MDITVNGEPKSLERAATLATLLEGMGIDARTVAIELSGEVVPRSEFPARTLEEGDRVEIVRFVQGG